MTQLQRDVFSLVVALGRAEYRTVASLLQRHPSAVASVAYSLRQRALIVVDPYGVMTPSEQVLA